MVHPCDDSGVILTAVDRAIGLELDSNPDPDANVNFDIDWYPDDCGYPEDPGTATVSVSVDYIYQPFTDFIIGILGGSTSFIMNSTSTMHLEL